MLSYGLPWHKPYLFHIPACGRYVGRYPFATCCVTRPTPAPSPIFKPNLLPLAIQTILKFSHSSPTSLWRRNRQSVPKRWHIKFRCRGITQKKTYKIQICLCFAVLLCSILHFILQHDETVKHLIYVPEQLAERITLVRKCEFSWCWQATNRVDEHRYY
jgi:hypothetical protein